MIPGTQKTVKMNIASMYSLLAISWTLHGIFTAIQKGSEGYSHFADEEIEI